MILQKVFFTSDLHFGHENVLRFDDRPFASVEEMDAELVRRGSLCGRRSQATEQVTENIFRDYTPPGEIRVITFSVPVAENLVANWTIELPADLYNEFEDDVARIIDSAQVEPR